MEKLLCLGHIFVWIYFDTTGYILNIEAIDYFYVLLLKDEK